MDDVVIRRGDPEDFGSAFAVWRAAETARRGGGPIELATEGRVRGHRRRPEALLLVADSAGPIVGMPLASPATRGP